MPSSLETLHPAAADADPGWVVFHFLLPLAATFGAYALVFRRLRRRAVSDKALGARLEGLFYVSVTGLALASAAHEWRFLGELRYVNDLTAFGMAYIVGFFVYELVCLQKRPAHIAHHAFFIVLFVAMASRPYYYGLQPLFVLFEAISLFNVVAWFNRRGPRAKPLFLLNLYVHAFSLALGPALLGFIALTATAHDWLILSLTIAGVVANGATVIERLVRSVDRLTLTPEPADAEVDPSLTHLDLSENPR